MLRYSLNNKDKVVPISFELTHTTNYLTIQKFRFEDRISFEINENVNTNQFYIPKFIMQPIIENSIKYGLDQHETCIIIITIDKTSDNEIVIRIKDNGPGINEKVLEKLNTSLRKDPMAGRDSSFGLINVHARISMIFGEPYGLEVNSRTYEGTEVILKLPMVTEAEVLDMTGGEDIA